MFYKLKLVFGLVILQRAVNCLNIKLKFNSLLISLHFLDLISQLAIKPDIICFCDNNYIYISNL